MTPPVDESGSVMLPYIFGLLQSIIVAILGYVAKLLRDLREEMMRLRLEVSRHDVKIDEQEKRHDLHSRDLDRRLSRLEEKD